MEAEIAQPAAYRAPQKGIHGMDQAQLTLQRKPGQRGRPRKYGDKYTAKRTAHLKRTVTTLRVHGREQEVRYRSKVLLARFLDGVLVRVVWCEYPNGKGAWKKPRLLLSTDTS